MNLSYSKHALEFMKSYKNPQKQLDPNKFNI